MQLFNGEVVRDLITYDSLGKTGPRANERHKLQTSLVNGKITHYIEEGDG